MSLYNHVYYTKDLLFLNYLTQIYFVTTFIYAVIKEQSNDCKTIYAKTPINVSLI
jgi:hypothetical protein